MGYLLFLLAGGLAMMVWPQAFVPKGPREHASRLVQLQAGAPEAFFEERRSLETYPPTKDKPTKDKLIWRRALGAAMLLFALGLLVFVRLPEWRQDAERKAALDEARAAVSASQVAVTRARVGDPQSQQRAETALARADAALDRSERLGN